MSGPYGPNNPDEQWSREAAGREAYGRGDGPDRQGGAPDAMPGSGQQGWGQQGWAQQDPSGFGSYGQQPYPQGQYPQGQYPQQAYGQQPYPQGQYPQGQYPPQQYGQGQYPPQQYPHAHGEQPVGRGRSMRTMYIAAGVVVLAVVIGVLVFVFGRTTYLDRDAAESGVELIVVGTYNAETVSGVTCPDDMTVERGATFECSLEVDGAFRTVTLTMTDDEGTYEVSRPR